MSKEVAPTSHSLTDAQTQYLCLFCALSLIKVRLVRIKRLCFPLLWFAASCTLVNVHSGLSQAVLMRGKYKICFRILVWYLQHLVHEGDVHSDADLWWGP
jgi:hypothetical protein